MEKVKNMGLKVLNEDEFYAVINDTMPKSDANPKIDAVSVKKEDVKAPVQSIAIMKEVLPVKNAEFKSQLVKPATIIAKGKGIQNNSSLLWTDKYKPSKFEDVVGNKGLVEKLSLWLNSWNANKKAGFPKGDSSFHAALLSGPPGIGKTTAAHLASKIANFEIIEFNASDTRSKKSLQNIVTETTHSGSIMNLFGGKKSEKHKKVLIMDEVDGMSSGDRGGSAELIKIIKNTGIPIICICNDRSSPKVRSLANHCLDLRFRRPTAQQIEKMVQIIAKKEGFRIESNAVGELVQSTSGDIRQILNILSTYARDSNSLNYDESKALFY